MKANSSIILIGDKVLLVPYLPCHVHRYHEWMKDDEIRDLTASEPLSYDEEVEMQKKWAIDEDKLTFIILAREVRQIPTNTEDPILDSCPMIGDVNIFFHNSEDDDQLEGEAEVMIAETSYRRGGRATEALTMMLQYITGEPASIFSFTVADIQERLPTTLKPTRLLARVKDSNVPSLKLFQNLGFHIVKHVEVFREVELRWKGRLSP